MLQSCRSSSNGCRPSWTVHRGALENGVRTVLLSKTTPETHWRRRRGRLSVSTKCVLDFPDRCANISLIGTVQVLLGIFGVYLEEGDNRGCGAEEVNDSRSTALASPRQADSCFAGSSGALDERPGIWPCDDSGLGGRAGIRGKQAGCRAVILARGDDLGRKYSVRQMSGACHYFDFDRERRGFDREGGRASRPPNEIEASRRPGKGLILSLFPVPRTTPRSICPMRGSTTSRDYLAPRRPIGSSLAVGGGQTAAASSPLATAAACHAQVPSVSRASLSLPDCCQSGLAEHRRVVAQFDPATSREPSLMYKR
jgi:hypothetical protein